MYGYVYVTYNKITGSYYIGQKKSEKFKPNYYGSGKYIKEELNLYGKKNFDVELLKEATDQEELDKLEKKYIKKFKKKYGNQCINQASGGKKGSNSFEYADDEIKSDFFKKMKEINGKRCKDECFKLQTSIRMKQKYEDPKERKKQSKKIRKAWADEILREEQSKRLKDYYKNHKKDNSYNDKKCRLIFPDSSIVEFERVKDLKKFLKDQFDINFPNPKLHKLLENNEVYFPFHKNKENLLKLSGVQFSFN